MGTIDGDGSGFVRVIERQVDEEKNLWVIFNQNLGPNKALLTYNKSSDEFEVDPGEENSVFTFNEMEILIQKKKWGVINIYGVDDVLEYQLK